MGDIFVFNLAHKVVKKEIKRKLKAGVPKEELFVIILSQSEIEDGEDGFRWVKKDKEFWYKGSMYDVVHQKDETGGKIRFECVNDDQEAQLFIHLESMIRKNLPDSENASRKTKILASGIIKTALPAHKLILTWDIRTSVFSFIKPYIKLQSFSPEVELPPT